VLAAPLLAVGLMGAGAQVAATAQDCGGAVAVAEYDLGDTAFTDPQTGTVNRSCGGRRQTAHCCVG
jgi:hypothetical protein